MNEKVIYPDLSYKLVGILFNVHKKLGNCYQEKYYQRAVKVALEKEGIKFKEQISGPIIFDGKMIGKYFLDFLIEDKIILELKTLPILKPQDYKQVKAYLKASGLKLGILVNFAGNNLVFKRILNINNL